MAPTLAKLSRVSRIFRAVSVAGTSPAPTPAPGVLPAMGVTAIDVSPLPTPPGVRSPSEFTGVESLSALLRDDNPARTERGCWGSACRRRLNSAQDAAHIAVSFVLLATL